MVSASRFIDACWLECRTGGKVASTALNKLAGFRWFLNLSLIVGVKLSMEFVSGMTFISNSNGWHIDNCGVSAYNFADKIFKAVNLSLSCSVIDLVELSFICFERLLGFDNGSVLFVGEE